MCDPTSLVSSGLGAGTKVMDAMGRQKAAQQQDQANKDNAMRQLILMQQHLATQNRMRGQSEGMWGAALDDMSASSQIARQTQEEARLASYLNGDTPAITGVKHPGSLDIKWWNEQPVNGGGASMASYSAPSTTDKSIAPAPSNQGGFAVDPNIAGSAQGGDVFQADLAYKLGRAARQARGQINNMAKVASYGGSYGGLGTVNPLILGNSGAAIDLWGNFRKGDMQVWDAERQIPATQYQYKQSPLSSLSGLFGAGMKGMGNSAGFGGMF